MGIASWYTPDILGAILGIAAATQPAPVKVPEAPPVPQATSMLSCSNLFTGKHHVAARGYTSARYIGDNTWVIVSKSGYSAAYVAEPGEACYRVNVNLEG